MDKVTFNLDLSGEFDEAPLGAIEMVDVCITPNLISEKDWMAYYREINKNPSAVLHSDNTEIFALLLALRLEIWSYTELAISMMFQSHAEMLTFYINHFRMHSPPIEVIEKFIDIKNNLAVHALDKLALQKKALSNQSTSNYILAATECPTTAHALGKYSTKRLQTRTEELRAWYMLGSDETTKPKELVGTANNGASFISTAVTVCRLLQFDKSMNAAQLEVKHRAGPATEFVKMYFEEFPQDFSELASNKIKNIILKYWILIRLSKVL